MPEQLNDHQGESENGFSSAEAYKDLATPEQHQEQPPQAEAPKPFQFTRKDLETGEVTHSQTDTNKIAAFEISEAFQGRTPEDSKNANAFNENFFKAMHHGYTEQLQEHPDNPSLNVAALHSELISQGMLLVPEAKDKDTRLALEMSKPSEPGSPKLYEAYMTGSGGSYGNFLTMIETVEEGQRVTRSVEATGNSWDPVLYREIVYPEGEAPLVRVYKESSDMADLKPFTDKVLELSDPDKVESHLSDSSRIAELGDARITDQTEVTLAHPVEEPETTQTPSLVDRIKESARRFADWGKGPSSLQEAEHQQ
jgi:hypothetical protein